MFDEGVCVIVVDDAVGTALFLLLVELGMDAGKDLLACGMVALHGSGDTELEGGRDSPDQVGVGEEVEAGLEEDGRLEEEEVVRF